MIVQFSEISASAEGTVAYEFKFEEKETEREREPRSQKTLRSQNSKDQRKESGGPLEDAWEQRDFLEAPFSLWQQPLCDHLEAQTRSISMEMEKVSSRPTR